MAGLITSSGEEGGRTGLGEDEREDGADMAWAVGEGLAEARAEAEVWYGLSVETEGRGRERERERFDREI